MSSLPCNPVVIGICEFFEEIKKGLLDKTLSNTDFLFLISGLQDIILHYMKNQHMQNSSELIC